LRTAPAWAPSAAARVDDPVMEVDDGAFATPGPGDVSPYSALPSSSNAGPVNKRKRGVGDNAKCEASAKAARSVLVDDDTGLPLPLGTQGDPHFAGRAWTALLSLYQGDNTFAQLRRAALHRYRPEWKAAISEIRAISKASSLEALGKAQRYALSLNVPAFTTLEMAMSNRSKASPAIRWDNDTPNADDIRVWQFMRAVVNRRPAFQTNAIRDLLEEVLLSDELWNASVPPDLGQSSGLQDQQFPKANELSHAEMVRHLVRCGVRMPDILARLRPWVARRRAAVAAPPIFAPGPVPTTAASVPAPQASTSASMLNPAVGPAVVDVAMDPGPSEPPADV
jgi:hypothetical protein